MGKEVFISYSRKDKEVVKSLVEEINQALGIKCWMDVDGIEGSTRFIKKLQEIIDECKVVLFMLSDNSSESEWTEREVVYADKQGKRVVPVIIDGQGLRGWSAFLLCTVQYVDISSKEQKEKLIDNLRKWLGVKKTNSIAKTLEAINPETVKTIMAEINEREAERETIENYLAKFENAKLIRIEKDGKYGFADESGNVVIPCRWKYAGYFYEGLAFVKDESKKFGFINKMGKVVIPCQWRDAWRFSEDLASVKGDNWKFGFVNKTGELVIPCQWKDVGKFSEGLAVVQDNNSKWGFIDKTGKVVIPCQWKDAESFSEGLALVQEDNGDWAKIDKVGNVVEWHDT